MTRPRFVFLAAFILGSAQAHGQGPSRSPEEVAAAVLKSDSLHDWRMLLALAHPEALLTYRTDLMQRFRVEDFPGMADAIGCLRKYHRFLLDSVFRVPTPDLLSRIPPETLFTREQRYYARNRAGAPRVPTDTFSVLPTWTVLGHVTADDSTVYVVVERRFPRPPTPDWPERLPEIMTLRLFRGEWRSMLDPDIASGSGAVMFDAGDCP